MLDTSQRSNSHAKSAVILGHTVSGMGEKSLALKFNRALSQAGFGTHPIIDIVETLGPDYEPLAKLNYDLANENHAPLDAVRPPFALPQSDLLLMLSWNFGIAALLATGVQQTRPTAMKLYAHHPQERILPKLYESAALVLTESLLGNERASTYGIDPGKTLYLPHSYPAECESTAPSRAYVERLAAEQGKSLRPQTRVIGCVGRLEYGKNCEWAVEAVRLLAAEGHDVVLVLKGDFPDNSPYPDFKPTFTRMLNTYRNEPWLLWDLKPTPFPEVMQEYASFDVLVHPSGAEGASHVVVECLGLQKPVVVLNCSTNPYLFKGLATFVKTDGPIRPAMLPFYVPEMKSLCKALTQDLRPPDAEKVRARFHETQLMQRMPLLFDPDPQTFKELYAHDRRCYGL